MRKQVKLQDVADLAGVHVSTASRVLRDMPGRIGEETANRILAAAEELGFQRNRWAASLRSGKTKTVGVLVPRITDVVLATVFEAIEIRAAELGYQAVVSSSWDDLESRRLQIRRYLGERVDGLIIADARVSDPDLDQLVKDGFPLVLVSRGSEGFPSVTGNDYRGGQLVANHLIDQGYRKLAVVAGPNYAKTAIDRVKGFQDAAKERSVEIDGALVVNSSFDALGGMTAMREILGKSTPDAIFAVNDFAAIGAMSALDEVGLLPGRDVAVAGYNDIDISSKLLVPLTSVRTPLEEMGRCAFDSLLELLDTGSARSKVLEPELMPRKATLFERVGAP